MIKKILFVILKALGIFIALVALYIIIAITTQFIGVNRNTDYRSPNDITIFIMTNGVHTDIVVPVKNAIMDWTTLVKPADAGLSDSTYQYVAMGWGDKGFYLQTPEWKDLKFSVAFRAAFHLGTAAIHATFYPYVQTDAQCVQLNISKTNYTQLVRYIKKDFLTHSNGRSIHIPSTNDGYGDNDAFYEARGSYSLFYTCNTWSNNALKAAGQRAALWTLTDKGIFYHYRH